jgi:hypothetical protein
MHNVCVQNIQTHEKNNFPLPIVRWEVYDEISPSISIQNTHLYVQKDKCKFVYKSNLHKMFTS